MIATMSSSPSIKQDGHTISIKVPDGMTVLEPILFEKLSEVMEFEVSVGEGASVTIVTLAVMEKVRIVQRGKIGSHASIHWFNVTLGADVDQSLISEIVGEHGTSDMDWLFFATGSERQTINARNNFSAPDGRGEIMMKGVAEGEAHVGCNGLIEIGLKGGGTNTYLTQNVLMLDPSARVDAIPGLEIKTNDVKASHSATIARVTEEDLFYFAARGIPPETARGMFIQGFLGAPVERISDAATKELVIASIMRKYKEGAHLGK